MRKMALMAALLLAAPALAADEKGSTKEETKEAGQAAGRDMREAGQRAEQKTEQTRDDMKTSQSRSQQDQQGQYGSQAQGQTTAQTPAAEQARDRMEKDSFDIDGKVAKVSKNSLTLNRENSPAAMLHVDSTTKIEVDGNQGRLSQLKPGQDVKASFNLKGDKAHAIEISAETNK